MKKKVIIKIILSIVSVAFFVFILVNAIQSLQNGTKTINIYLDFIERQPVNAEQYKKIIATVVKSIIFGFLYCIPPLLLLVVIWLSDFKIISISLIKTVKEYRIKTTEQRETKRQAKIQRKIAQKQAEIERLNNSAKNE